MTTLETAARQALEALESIIGQVKYYEQRTSVIVALRQALEQPKQEPVRWMYDWKNDGLTVTDWVTSDKDEAYNLTKGHFNIRPLYTEPPKREWVGLKDTELVAAYMSVGDKEWAIGGMEDATKFTKALEAKLKEKNA